MYFNEFWTLAENNRRLERTVDWKAVALMSLSVIFHKILFFFLRIGRCDVNIIDASRGKKALVPAIKQLSKDFSSRKKC